MSELSVMDASAILAVLLSEPGEAVARAALLASESMLTTVNYAEVVSKLRERGAPLDDVVQSIEDLKLQIRLFDRELAAAAGDLRTNTKRIGASLGDRACLACAAASAKAGDKVTVYTADKLWLTLRWPFRVVAIR